MEVRTKPFSLVEQKKKKLNNVLVCVKPFWFLLNKRVQLLDTKEEIKVLLQCFVHDLVQSTTK